MAKWENSRATMRRIKAREERLHDNAESMLACLKRAEQATALAINLTPEGSGKLHLLAMRTDLVVNIKKTGL
jgi:hypothetical protein